VSLAHRSEHVTEATTAKRPRRCIEANREHEQPSVRTDDRVNRTPDIKRPDSDDAPANEEHERPHDGEPTVPDATITYLPGRDLPRALKESFPADARTEPLTFGDDRTTGLRVTSVYRTPDGDPYEESGYLIEAPEGTYRIGRYESFDWAPFDAAVRSFRFVHLVPSDARD